MVSSLLLSVLMAAPCLTLALAAAASPNPVPLALGGFDVVSCSSMKQGKGCDAVGTESLSVQYSSVDSTGNPLFTAEFRFETQENMLAFENAPFSFAPRLGGFCAWGLANMNNSTTTESTDVKWAADLLGPPVDLVNSWRAVASAGVCIWCICCVFVCCVFLYCLSAPLSHLRTNTPTPTPTPADGLPASIYLFSSEESASSFTAGLPASQQQAEAQWAAWYGSHGTQAPYALSAGPFNSACYTQGDPSPESPPRDCSVSPMRVPTK